MRCVDCSNDVEDEKIEEADLRTEGDGGDTRFEREGRARVLTESLLFDLEGTSLFHESLTTGGPRTSEKSTPGCIYETGI